MPTQNNDLIVVKDLKKSFKETIHALTGVHLTIH